jgi:dTDP-4-dehydrorhamnose 3,5-epimerase
MQFKKLSIEGLYLITHNLFNDHRGMFGREFCSKEIDKFFKYSPKFRVAQTNISFNKKKGTLRGFHYQIGKSAETKIITLYQGEIYDVIIDLRKKSKTYKKWASIKINSNKIQSLIIPKGCANAFLTLKDNTIVHYITNKNYNKKSERGIRFNNIKYNIKWPLKPKIISKKDMAW